MPIEIDDLERRISHLEIERQALNRGTDAASHERLRQVENELERLRGEAAVLKERWNREKTAITRVRQLKEEQEQAAPGRGEGQRARAIGKRPRNCATAGWRRSRRTSRRPSRSWKRSRRIALLKEEIGEDDIARIVAKWTGIPVAAHDGRRGAEAGAHAEGG